MRTPVTEGDRVRWREEGNKLLPRVHFTATPCPKCGRPTLEDDQARWRFCMFNDGDAPIARIAGSPPAVTCDYGECL